MRCLYSDSGECVSRIPARHCLCAEMPAHIYRGALAEKYPIRPEVRVERDRYAGTQTTVGKDC